MAFLNKDPRDEGLIVGSFLCLMAVVIGAFGAHALSDLLVANDRVETFELANRYQFYHGLGLMLISVARINTGRISRFCNAFMFAGTLVFCGSLYLLCLTNASWLGAITPIGGLLLVVAWIMALIGAWRRAD